MLKMVQPNPTSLLKAVTYATLLRAMSSQVFNISKNRYFATGLDNLFQCLMNLNSPSPKKKKKSGILSMFKGHFLHFSLCLLSLMLSQNITEKILAPSPLLPPIRYLYTLVKPQNGYISVSMKVKVIRNRQKWFIKCKSCLTKLFASCSKTENLIAFHNKMSGFVDKERTLDTT